MAIIERQNRDGSIRYRVMVRDQEGQWFPASAFEKMEDALREEARLLELKRKGAQAVSSDAKTVTLNEFWEVWSEENRAKVSEGWKISQNQMFRDYIRPVIGELTMLEIKAPEIGRVLNSVRKLGRSEQTCKHVYSLLRTMFNDAVEYYEMLAKSPVKAKFHRPKVPEKQRPFLEPALAWRLLEHVESHPFLGTPIWLQVLAGLRLEAVIGLTWANVSWDKNQILICRAWKQKIKRLENYPKGRSWEYVPLIPDLREFLWRKWEACMDSEAFVAPGPKGDILSYNTYVGAVPRICRQAGVPEMTSHELRHSCTEIWVETGANAEDIRRLLNHTSLTATKRYMHRTDGRLSSIGQKIGRPSLRAVGGKAVLPRMLPNGNKETHVSLAQDVQIVQ